jgi:hypothetical protein
MIAIQRDKCGHQHTAILHPNGTGTVMILRPEPGHRGIVVPYERVRVTEPEQLAPEMAVSLFAELLKPLLEGSYQPLRRQCWCGCGEPMSSGCVRRSAHREECA